MGVSTAQRSVFTTKILLEETKRVFSFKIKIIWAQEELVESNERRDATWLPLSVEKDRRDMDLQVDGAMRFTSKETRSC